MPGTGSGSGGKWWEDRQIGALPGAPTIEE